MQVKVTDKSEEFGSCGCGRSPIGKCIGWHGLTQEQYLKELEKYEQNLFESNKKGDLQ